jgi:hypothetical protein
MEKHGVVENKVKSVHEYMQGRSQVSCCPSEWAEEEDIATFPLFAVFGLENCSSVGNSST